jgi:two-component system sensor histidine kinase KdpD
VNASAHLGWPRVAQLFAWQAVSLAMATVVVAVLEEGLAVHDAWAVYLLAVAWVAIQGGSWPAAGTALASFLLYNFLFVPPRFTFAVANAQSALTLVMLLALGILIGRLAGAQRDRAAEAVTRERAARSLFAVSRELAAAKRTREALASVLTRIGGDLRLKQIWVGLGPTVAQEQVAAATDLDASRPAASASHFLLRRTADDDRAEWIRISPPVGQDAGPGSPVPSETQLYRLEISDGDGVSGSIWAIRDAALGRPSIEETRLLAATADQIGQGIRRDRLAAQATELEVARRSDEAKSALLDSVSHDLRTPLASIRAAAGNIADPALAWSVSQRMAAAREIDADAERMNRLVGTLLDMSRIRAGALHPETELIPLDELIEGAVHRASPELGVRTLKVDLPQSLPPLEVDPVLADQVLANLLENIARHTPADTPARISGSTLGSGMVRLTVEDGGPGVPDGVRRQLFDAFYHSPGSPSSRGGSGLGLAVVRGLVEALGGTVVARASELGGVAVDVDLPARVAPTSEAPPNAAISPRLPSRPARDR